MEGLGAAASVIAVASLALQLAESVRHLCEFWQSITDAPESVRDIAKELHGLSTILGSIAMPERQNEIMKLALENCASRIELLHSISRPLMEQFCSTSKAKRKWAAIKTVFNAEKISQFRDAMERTKTTLVLANQQHLMSMVTAGFQEQQLWRNTMTHLVIGDRSQKNILGAVFSDVNLPPMCGRIEEINENQSHEIEDGCREIQSNITSISRPKIRRRRAKIAASYTGISSIFGNITLKSQTFSTQSDVYPSEEEDGQQTGESYLTVRPAPWLARFGLKYGIRVAISQSPGNWKHVLNTFRPVPDESLIFEFCKLGNIDGVRLLLDRGEASTWDTNSRGRTPLHVAARNCHPQLCKVLLEVGADAEARDDKASSCFNIACTSWDAVASSTKIDILRLFIHQADLSEPGSLDWNSIESLANGQFMECGADSHYVPGLSSFTWVVKMLKESMRENIGADEMADILWYTSWCWSKKDMKAILAYFNSPTNIVEWAGWTPLHYCVWFQDHIAARSLLQQSAKIHSTAFQSYWSPVEESPTSISLYSSGAFFAWRQILEDEQLPFEEFIAQELQQGPLKRENWDKYSLMQVFTLNLKPAIYPDYCCEACLADDQHFSLVEIAWQDILQQFNPNEEITDLLDELRLIDDSSSFGSVEEHEKCKSQHLSDSTAAETKTYSGINLPDMENGPSTTVCDETPGNYRFIVEWVCVYCWHTMLGTPGADRFIDSNGWRHRVFGTPSPYDFSDSASDTDDENSDNSGSDGDDPGDEDSDEGGSDGDDSSSDDNDDQDCDSSSDDSPFLLAI